MPKNAILLIFSFLLFGCGGSQIPTGIPELDSLSGIMIGSASMFYSLALLGYYAGQTEISTCSSTLRGASYATSEVDIQPGVIMSWDRGFDADGIQVWGAEKGGYIFIKK